MSEASKTDWTHPDVKQEISDLADTVIAHCEKIEHLTELVDIGILCDKRDALQWDIAEAEIRFQIAVLDYQKALEDNVPATTSHNPVQTP